MNVTHTLLLIAAAVVVTFLLRAFPFVIFNGKRQMPQKVKTVADMLPPAIMGVLVIYCLKDYILAFGSTDSIEALIAVASVVIIHLWKRNTLLSIAVGTAVYMLLIRIL